MEKRILLGQWSEARLEELIKKASQIEDLGERIAILSGALLGTHYEESTLLGDASNDEVFVIDLEGVDCFTFIDYVEAMRLSQSFVSFLECLRHIRYRSGIVSFDRRNHFFTDWVVSNERFIQDVTGIIGKTKANRTRKILNLRSDGTVLLPGIGAEPRDLVYIPGEAVDEPILNRVQTGDYLGIYSDIPGLDVSHVGVIIRTGNALLLRHASSAPEARKVIDQDLRGYLSGKPGISLLRPRKP
jgi:hypothetical protein